MQNGKEVNAFAFSGFITNSELFLAYHVARAIIIPSLNEGFGMPALEAMCCGCPVVAANNSALIEIVGDAGILVQGWDKKDWIEAIIQADENYETFQKKGFKKAAQYDWNEISLRLIRELIELNH
jgi:glycosyltransferase involved in cell wall biosynthesis